MWIRKDLSWDLECTLFMLTANFLVIMISVLESKYLGPSIEIHFTLLGAITLHLPAGDFVANVLNTFPGPICRSFNKFSTHSPNLLPSSTLLNLANYSYFL